MLFKVNFSFYMKDRNIKIISIQSKITKIITFQYILKI